jgi:tetratricopeptide (TPR) repeat protein
VVAQAYTAHGEEAEATVFMEGTPGSPWYVLIDEAELLFQVNWFGYWAEGAAGSAEIYAELTAEPTEGEPLFTDAESGEFGEDGPLYINKAVVLPFEADEVGRYGVTISVTALAAGEGAIAEGGYSTEVVALSRPVGDFPDDGEPRFGTLEEDGFFLDWRGWRGGPCRTSVDDAAVTRTLDEACLVGEDAEALAALLTEALEGDLTPAEQARIREQAGYAYAARGDWEIAARQFREALRRWEDEDDAYAVAVALHNLGVAEGALGRPAEALLVQAIELREQMDDWSGFFVTWAQLGVLWQDAGTLYEAAEALEELGWPQADRVREFALEFDEF